MESKHKPIFKLLAVKRVVLPAIVYLGAHPAYRTQLGHSWLWVSVFAGVRLLLYVYYRRIEGWDRPLIKTVFVLATLGCLVGIGVKDAPPSVPLSHHAVVHHR